MPVIIVGADTALGGRITDAILEPDREVRAFVTDVASADELRAKGVKVALGDVSDSSHVEGAATHCFSVVLITEAAVDGRERSFARDPRSVLEGWADAARSASVTRVIWVSGDPDVPAVPGVEVAVVDPARPDAAAEVVRLDDVASL